MQPYLRTFSPLPNFCNRLIVFLNVKCIHHYRKIDQDCLVSFDCELMCLFLHFVVLYIITLLVRSLMWLFKNISFHKRPGIKARLWSRSSIKNISALSLLNSCDAPEPDLTKVAKILRLVSTWLCVQKSINLKSI